MFRIVRTKQLVSIACVALGAVTILHISMYKEYSKREDIRVVSGKESTQDHKNLQRIGVTSKLPEMIILWSRWRSGSSFVGKLLAIFKPNTFYSYEPLHQFGVFVMRDDDLKTNYGRVVLQDFANCRFHLHRNIYDYLYKEKFFIDYNDMAVEACTPREQCKNPTVLGATCRKTHLHIIKVLRLSLKWGFAMLEHNSNAKIVYLTRDPRPTLKSRSRLLWCLMKDCHDPKTVCDLMTEDAQYALALKRTFPNRFFYARYEDIAQDPELEFRSLLQKLGHEYTKEADYVIDSITKKDISTDAFGLQKYSRNHTFAWRNSVDYKTLNKVQKYCSKTLKYLGYTEFKSLEDYENISVPATTLNIPIFESLRDSSLLPDDVKDIVLQYEEKGKRGIQKFRNNDNIILRHYNVRDILDRFKTEVKNKTSPIHIQ